MVQTDEELLLLSATAAEKLVLLGFLFLLLISENRFVCFYFFSVRWYLDTVQVQAAWVLYSRSDGSRIGE